MSNKDKKNTDKKVPQEPTMNGDLETQLAEMENNWKRALADYQNLQKRSAEEKISFAKFANGTLIRKLLPVMDNLEITLKHFEDESLGMIVKELQEVLKDEGVSEVEAEGKDFDATTMEAIEMVPGEKNKVIEVLEKGYLLKDRLLRPAKVNVGLGKD